MGLSRRRSSLIPPANQSMMRFHGDPLSDHITKLTDAQFAKWYGLLFNAMTHELSNSLKIFELEDVHRAEQLQENFGRIRALCTLSQGKMPYLGRGSYGTFNRDEREALGMGEDGSLNVPFDAIRKLSTSELIAFRTELLAFSEQEMSEKMAEFAEAAERCIDYGLLLSDALLKLMVGNQDFDSDVVTQRLFDEDSKSTVAHRWRKAAEDNSCIINEDKIRGKTRETEVLVNPLFCALIFQNIFSNSKRAMVQSGAQLVVEVSFYADTQVDKVGLQFRDHGGGMERKVRNRLNSSRPVSTKVDEPGEHGIGFMYCHQLAQKMGGDLSVKRTGKTGTSVVLELHKAQ